MINIFAPLDYFLFSLIKISFSFLLKSRPFPPNKAQHLTQISYELVNEFVCLLSLAQSSWCY